MRLRLLILTLGLATAAAHAQIVPSDPDWREADAPPPPALKLDGLVPLEMPGSTLKYGVDPASVSIGEDRIVRYVVVASSTSGAVNAMYEGVRCATGEFKVYARYHPQSGWTIAKDSTWRSLKGTASRHSMVVARTGACQEHATNKSARQIVIDLGASADRRFGN